MALSSSPIQRRLHLVVSSLLSGSITQYSTSARLTGAGTKQVCFFRDQYASLTSTGFSIYGLSKDSPKLNTSFKQKQKLPYPLLCDANATLISAIGLKKAPAGTTRGVFVIDKSGKVLAAQPGSPSGTVEVVEKLVGSGGPASEDKVEEPEAESTLPAANGVDSTEAPSKEDVAQADVASEVADTAEKLDSNEEKPAAA